ncbi:hypothetical protein [Nocardia flavorosea]|uniref:Uncharacterized protein n=1 Tax=Nocardia flavorosea TaxID=53429 RepID=A0A846YJ47_9NOCA|nr:hypothetical protein [Nocardia flavorosea]NKY59137.1 hypothetical protein [Nocardia flavorosea]
MVGIRGDYPGKGRAFRIRPANGCFGSGTPDCRPARSRTSRLDLDTATAAAVLDLRRSHGVSAVQVAWAMLLTALTALTGRPDVVRFAT